MRVGVFYFPTDYGINLAELARALEDRGFDSLFVPEHTHIPTSRRSPFPAAASCPSAMPTPTIRSSALAFAAAATKKLKVGTGICLVPQHEPIVTAKAIATLDQLSGGRFIFGIGGGWNVDEMENHGARYETRFKQMREHVLAMKALWTEEEASFHGEFVKFDPSGRGPSRRSGRIRRSSWAARPTIRCAASWNIATAGFRGRAAASTSSRASRGCVGWRPRRAGIPPR